MRKRRHKNSVFEEIFLKQRPFRTFGFENAELFRGICPRFQSPTPARRRVAGLFYGDSHGKHSPVAVAAAEVEEGNEMNCLLAGIEDKNTLR
jgi:hypothetical protein